MKSGRDMRCGCVPFIPFYGGVVHECGKLLRKRTTGKGDGETALLVDRLFLCFEDEGGEAVDELGVGRE